MTLEDIVRQKGGEVAAVLDDANVGEVAELMLKNRIGSVVVRTRAGSILGIVNERALVEAVAICGADLAEARATEVMLAPAPSVHADTSIIDGFRTMTERRFRHLLVTDGSNAIGVVSIGDLVKWYIHDMELENAVLRDMTAATLVAGEREAITTS